MLPRPQVTGNGHLLSPDGSPASSVFQGVTSIALAIVDTTGYDHVDWSILSKRSGSTASLASATGFTNTLTVTGLADAIDLRLVAWGTDGRSTIHVVHIVAPTPVLGLAILDRTDPSVEPDAQTKLNAAIDAIESGGASNATSIQGVPVDPTTPTTGASLTFDGSKWAPGAASGDATSIQGTPVDATDPTLSGQVLVYDGLTKYVARKLTTDDLGPGASTTLTKTAASLLEIGATDAAPAFTSSPSSTPSSALVTDTDGNTAQDVTSTPTGWSSEYNYTKTTNGASVTWTLTEIIGGVTKTATASRSWGIRAYYGATSTSNATIAAMDAATLEAFVEALPSSVLATSRTRSLFSTSLTAGQHLVIEIPTAWGTPVFKDENGLVITATTIASGTRTNASGASIAFTLYDVSAVAVGAATVQVSVS